MFRVAIALFPGVSGDECEAFTLALGPLPQVELVGVGAELGPVAGLGPSQRVERTFLEVTRPDVVIVPGGLGCRRAADDPELAGWLRRVEPTCTWLVGSSTGTVVLAAAGLLDERPVATHWLATDLLATYGSAASTERIVEYGRIITCEGKVTAVDVALLLIARALGPEWANRARAGLAHSEWSDPPAPRRPLRDRLATLLARTSHVPGRPRNPELEVSDWIEDELIEMQVDDAWAPEPKP